MFSQSSCQSSCQFSCQFSCLHNFVFPQLSDGGRFSELSNATLSWKNLNVKADKWVKGSICSDKKGHFVSSDILKNGMVSVKILVPDWLITSHVT